MSHLPDIALRTWRPREPLSAADLNANFAALLSLIEVAMVAALTPDPAAVGNEVVIARHAERIAALEHLTSLHARQRNEKEWAPMAHVAAVMQQVRDLRERLERLEQRPASEEAAQ